MNMNPSSVTSILSYPRPRSSGLRPSNLPLMLLKPRTFLTQEPRPVGLLTELHFWSGKLFFKLSLTAHFIW